MISLPASGDTLDVFDPDYVSKRARSRERSRKTKPSAALDDESQLAEGIERMRLMSKKHKW